MECAGVRERLSCYLDAELDEYTLELIEAHLADCPECRRELALLRAVVDASGAVEQVDAPRNLRSAISKAVRRAADCSSYTDLLSAYVDGELTARQRERVAIHLQACPHCTTEVEVLGRLAIAALEVTPVEPPADLRGRIRSATTGGETARRPVETIFTRLLHSGKLRWAGGAIAAAACAMVFGLMLSAPQLPQSAKRAEPEAPASRVAVQPAPSHTPVAVAPASKAPSVEVASSVVHRERMRVALSPTVAPGAVKSKPNSVKPLKPAAGSPDTTEAEPSEVAEAPVAEASEPEPAETAAGPKPAPVIAPVEHRSLRPALTRVASAPAASTDDAESFIKEVKASAVMRRSGGSGGIQLFSSKF